MNGAVKDIVEYISQMTYCVAITPTIYDGRAGHIQGVTDSLEYSTCIAVNQIEQSLVILEVNGEDEEKEEEEFQTLNYATIAQSAVS